jgi:hypothetical protein
VLKKNPALKISNMFPANLWLGLLVFSFAWFFIWPLTSSGKRFQGLTEKLVA